MNRDNSNRTLERTLAGVTIGHALHDSWYGVAPVLLAAMSALPTFGLTNSDIGLILLFYQAISSVTQPFFGRLSERMGGRWLGVGAIIWTTLMFSGAVLAPSKLFVAICVALAGFGSGAWHPQGTANATIAGGKRYGATAAALFFTGGTLGTALLGSALGGFLLDKYGRQSLLLIAVLVLFVTLTVVRQIIPNEPTAVKKAVASGHSNGRDRTFWVILSLLLGGIALRSLTNTSLTTYIPKYYQDLGASPATYGGAMSLFLVAVAIGGVVGSYLADRIGLQRVLAISLSLSALCLFGFLRADGMWSYVLLALLGFWIGPSHTLFVVAGQRRFPERMAMMAGVFLGFTFVSGAGGAWVLGLVADHLGLKAVLSILPWALFAAAGCALLSVPNKSPEAATEPERVPAA